MINNKVGLGSLGHPGIFIGQTRVKGLTNHLDIPYVTALEGAKTDKLDFGVLDLWALKQRTDSPLLSLAVENAQIIYTNADYYTLNFQVQQKELQGLFLVDWIGISLVWMEKKFRL